MSLPDIPDESLDMTGEGAKALVVQGSRFGLAVIDVKNSEEQFDRALLELRTVDGKEHRFFLAQDALRDVLENLSQVQSIMRERANRETQHDPRN